MTNKHATRYRQANANSGDRSDEGLATQNVNCVVVNTSLSGSAPLRYLSFFPSELVVV